MRLVILGGPGAGKGTQAQQLCNNLNIPLLAVGDILREEIAGETDLGKLAVSYVEKGELVPDEILIRFIGRRLLLWDVFNGWLLEGYPRTAFQAEELDFLLEDLAQELDWAVWLKVPHEVLLSRSIERDRSDRRARNFTAPARFVRGTHYSDFRVLRTPEQTVNYQRRSAARRSAARYS